MKKVLLTALSGLLIGALTMTARAAPYPGHAIELVVPAGAGTTTDLIARLFGAELGQELGQPVVIQNKPGASGNIAHEYVARSAPDGYTLVLGNTGPLAINPALYKNLPFDPIKDFTPVALLGYTPTLLAVRADSPWSTPQDLVAAAKQNPGKLNFSSAGNGTTGHLAAELLKIKGKADIVHVPYKQGTQAVTAVIAGDVDFIFYHPAVIIPLINGGKLKALGVSSAARTASDPSIVPIAEAGYPGFDLTGWFSVNAPKGLPPDVLDALVNAGDKVVSSAKFLDGLKGFGIQPLKMNHEEATRYMSSELDKWSEVVKLSGARVD